MEKIDTSAEAVEAVAQERDEKAAIYGDLAKEFPGPSGFSVLAQNATHTAAMLRALLAERDAERAKVAQAERRGAEAMAEGAKDA